MSEPNFIPFVLSTDSKNEVSKRLFLNVIQYIDYCYKKMLLDRVKYSEKESKKTTSLKFEDFLKFKFIDDYLKCNANKRSCNIYDIQTINFLAEVEQLYAINNYTQADKIDILVTNLPIDCFEQEIAKEDIYFAFECKRLANNSKNKNYIGDIEKFVNREYKFRLPYNGMIGFVEKINQSIETIITDIENRLKKHKSIKTIIIDEKILQNIPIKDITHNRYSIHKHNSLGIQIEIGHLFLDYSNIIVK